MDSMLAKKVFPCYMQKIELPSEAREEELTVYRICKYGKIDEESFLSSYEEYEKHGRLADLDLKDVSSYSLSCWGKIRDARRSLAFFTKKEPRAIAARGITSVKCGIIQRTKERKGRNAKSHIDWWLYQGAKPYEYFQEVELSNG